MSAILRASATTILEPVESALEVRLIRAVNDLRRGHPVILVDDFDRENEADLVVAAERISIAAMAMLIRECSGIVCLCLTEEACNRLELPPMCSNNENRFKTPSTVSIEARKNITTGVSAADRVTTIRTAIANNAVASDLTRPGHVFPLRAAAGGVLERRGHTEGSVELARLAELKPVAVLCELTNPDGTMARGSDIETFAARHSMVVLSIEELVNNKIRVRTQGRTHEER
jgi:3,4-dihydroxy 2-butanone 4-phosphate synthase